MMISDGFAIVYDLGDPDTWRQAHAHCRLWGRRYCQHYVLDEDHLLIVFMPGGDRWASWEAHRRRWILGQELVEDRAA
jgi:hypothetical protein